MIATQLFGGLTKPQIDRIVEAGMICPLPRGKTLFRKGELGHEMYLILTGKIRIIDEYGGCETTIAELGPGEIFGEMATFEEAHTRSTNAVAAEPSQVLVLNEDLLKELLHDNRLPKRFLVNIIAVICRRIRATNGMYMHAKYGLKRHEPAASAAMAQAEAETMCCRGM